MRTFWSRSSSLRRGGAGLEQGTRVTGAAAWTTMVIEPGDDLGAHGSTVARPSWLAMSRYVVAVTAILVLGVGLLLWWALSTKPPRPPAGAAPSPGDRQRGAEPQAEPAEKAGSGVLEAKGVQIEKKSTSGAVEWKLKAEGRFVAEKDKGTATGHDVHWELMTKEGPHWICEAPVTQIDNKAGTLEFSEGVQLRTASGELSLEAPRLTYQSDTRKLIAQGPVAIKVKAGSLRAREAVIDTRKQELRAKGIEAHYRF